MVEGVQGRVRFHGGVGVVAVVAALAAVEVLVDTGVGEAVEALHRLLEGVGRHPDLVGQAGEGVGLLHGAVLVPAAWERLPGGEPREQVPVAVALVDDHPGRDVRNSGGLAGVDRVHRLDVGHGLVHEPSAGGVHDDRAGEIALGQAEPRTRRQG